MEILLNIYQELIILKNIVKKFNKMLNLKDLMQKENQELYCMLVEILKWEKFYIMITMKEDKITIQDTLFDNTINRNYQDFYFFPLFLETCLLFFPLPILAFVFIALLSFLSLLSTNKTFLEFFISKIYIIFLYFQLLDLFQLLQLFFLILLKYLLSLYCKFFSLITFQFFH